MLQSTINWVHRLVTGGAAVAVVLRCTAGVALPTMFTMLQGMGATCTIHVQCERERWARGCTRVGKTAEGPIRPPAYLRCWTAACLPAA